MSRIHSSFPNGSTYVALVASFVGLVAAGCSDATSATPTAPASGIPSAQRAQAGGPPKASSGVRAYAYTTGGPNPTLDPSRTRGFIAITSPAVGVYCLTPADGISPASAPALVSLGTNDFAIVLWDQLGTVPVACPAGDYRVTVVSIPSTGEYSVGGGFTILVP
jgi:hypothetical protein